MASTDCHQLCSASDDTSISECLLRPRWVELTRRLCADSVTDELYEREIISRREREKVEQKAATSRYEGAALLLEIMLTRSWSECVQFAHILSETIGINDLGRRLVADAGNGDDIDSRGRSSLVSENRQLRRENESLAKEKKLAERKEKAERLLRVGYEMKEDGEEKASAVTQYKWKPWKYIPRVGGYINCVATVQDKVIAADWWNNQLYISDIHSSRCCWSTVGNTHNTSGGNIHTLFNAGDECLGTFYKEGGKASIGKYTMGKNEWQHVIDMPSVGRLWNYGIAADRHHVCIVGGEDGWNISNKITIFDVKTGTQCGRAKISSKRMGCWCSIIDNMLYVGGGDNGWQDFNRVECVSLTDHSKHNRVAPTPTFQCSVTSFCGRLVMTGGKVGRGVLSPSSTMVAVLTPSLNTWLPLPAMNQKRRWHGTCAVGDDTLMVVSGRDGTSIDGLSSVEVLKV